MSGIEIENIGSKHLYRSISLGTIATGSEASSQLLDRNSIREESRNMIRTKLGLLGLCAIVLGVMAMSASSAQAALSWLVLNSAGTTATELKAELVGEKDSTHLTLLTKLVGLKIAVTCTNFELKGVNLETGGKLTEGGKVTFTGCQAYENKGEVLGTNLGCTVKSPGAAASTVETLEGKGELTLHTLAAGGTEVLTKISPKGTDFATLRFEGCALTEVNPVRGVLYIKDGEGFALTHKVKHLIVEGPLTALYLGAHSAEKLAETKIDGSAWVKLGSAHKDLSWSGMDA